MIQYQFQFQKTWFFSYGFDENSSNEFYDDAIPISTAGNFQDFPPSLCNYKTENIMSLK